MALRRLGDLGREVERRRQPDPYPRANGPAPSLEQLRLRSGAITRVAAGHGARTVRIFGSVARGEETPGSDLDVLVEMDDGRSLFDTAALQRDFEELLGCAVHVVTASGLSHAREHTRERIERETVSL
jgi:predicted nucleotidyltransferase